MYTIMAMKQELPTMSLVKKLAFLEIFLVADSLVLSKCSGKRFSKHPPYNVKIDDFNTFGGFPKFRNFQNI